MKITYDKEADAAYIYLRKMRRSFKNLCIGDNVILDFGAKGEILGIEILSVSRYIPVKNLGKLGVVMLPA